MTVFLCDQVERLLWILIQFKCSWGGTTLAFETLQRDRFSYLNKQSSHDKTELFLKAFFPMNGQQYKIKRHTPLQLVACVSSECHWRQCSVT